MKAITTGNFSEGASTITQQLLKNNVFTDWTNESTQLERFTRKFQEQYLAVQIEKKYDKNVILENYLKTINLGAGSYLSLIHICIPSSSINCFCILLCILFPWPAARTIAVFLHSPMINYPGFFYLSPSFRFGTAFRSQLWRVPLIYS